jgi:hypothetical protein
LVRDVVRGTGAFVQSRFAFLLVASQPQPHGVARAAKPAAGGARPTPRSATRAGGAAPWFGVSFACAGLRLRKPQTPPPAEHLLQQLPPAGSENPQPGWVRMCLDRKNNARPALDTGSQPGV